MWREWQMTQSPTTCQTIILHESYSVVSPNNHNFLIEGCSICLFCFNICYCCGFFPLHTWRSFRLAKFLQPFPVPFNITKPSLLREHKAKDTTKNFQHSFPEEVHVWTFYFSKTLKLYQLPNRKKILINTLIISTPLWMSCSAVLNVV